MRESHSSHVSAANATRQRVRRRGIAGFTLVELMITLAVAAILAMIAVPSFRHILNSTHLAGVNNDLSSDLQYARTIAVSRQVSVAVAASSGGWQDGWRVQIPSSSTAASAVPEVLRRHSAVPVQYTIAAAAASTVTYRPQGSISDTAGTCFTIYTKHGVHNDPHYLQVLPAGMLQQSTGGTTPTTPNCPTPTP